MKRLAIALALWLCAPLLASAQTVNLWCWNPTGSGLNQWVPCSTNNPLPAKSSGTYIALGYQQLSSLSSAAALTVPAGATIAEICVETASVRYRDDGTNPTTSVGMLVAPASSTIPSCFQYGGPLAAIKFIAVSGSPVIDVSYYQ